MKNEIKNIVIWDVPNHPWMSTPFLKRLKNEHGARIHFIYGDSPGLEYWKRLNNDNTIDTFTGVNHFFFEYDKCDDPLEEIYSKARYYEGKYRTLAVDLLQADRHLGRGFFAGGIGHPRSRLSDKASYKKSINMFNAMLDFWQGYFERTKADLIIGIAGGIIGKGCAVVARHNGIPIRNLVSAKYKSYYHWVTDEYYTCPAIKKNFDSSKEPEGVIDDLDSLDEICHQGVGDVYENFSRLGSRRMLIRRILIKSANHISRRCKRLVSLGNYRLTEEIKYLYRAHRDLKRIHKLNGLSVKELSALSYIFSPLHMEPETALGVFSPEFNEQLATIELLAKNLPAGVYLAIKEHLLAMGRRPRDFYETIRNIPNVVMVGQHEKALNAAKMARCVAVITSSLGQEAAILGIPVISVGLHNNFNFLPHVHIVESWKELRPLLYRLCAEEDSEEAKGRRKKDGIRYLEAVKAASVNLPWAAYVSKKRKPATAKEQVEVLYASLMESLKG